jgi:hypothetical protein
MNIRKLCITLAASVTIFGFYDRFTFKDFYILLEKRSSLFPKHKGLVYTRDFRVQFCSLI